MKDEGIGGPEINEGDSGLEPSDSDAQQRRLPSSFRLKPSAFSSWWRAILGTLLVLAGLATAMVTLFARRLGAPELAGAGAIASLIFVLLIVVLVVPPL